MYVTLRTYKFYLLERRCRYGFPSQRLVESTDERELAGATELSSEVIQVEVPHHPATEFLLLQPLHLRYSEQWTILVSTSSIVDTCGTR